MDKFASMSANVKENDELEKMNGLTTDSLTSAASEKKNHHREENSKDALKSTLEQQNEMQTALRAAGIEVKEQIPQQAAAE